MGSRVLKSAKDYYFLGLWLADGYWRSSSIGLSSTNKTYLIEFEGFLKKIAPGYDIKERIYKPKKGEKRSLIAKHIYVNSRKLTRFFMSFKSKLSLDIPFGYLPAYFAGRIDGDGHFDRKYRTGIRISYSDEKDARRDLELLFRLNNRPASLYFYSTAKTWVIYFRKKFFNEFFPRLYKYSHKLK